jgi:hypothetical protein
LRSTTASTERSSAVFKSPLKPGRARFGTLVPWGHGAAGVCGELAGKPFPFPFVSLETEVEGLLFLGG